MALHCWDQLDVNSREKTKGDKIIGTALVGINYKHPPHIMLKKGPIHKLPTSQFMSPTRPPQSVMDLAPCWDDEVGLSLWPPQPAECYTVSVSPPRLLQDHLCDREV